MGKKNKIKGKDNSKKQPNEKNNQQKKRPNTNEGPKNTKKQKLEEKLEIVLKFENYFTKKSQDNRCLTIRDIQNFVLWGYNLTSSPQWVEVKGRKQLQRTVIISLGSIDHSIFDLFSEHFTSFSKFINAGEMRLPGSKKKCYPAIQAFLTHKQKKNNPTPPKPLIPFEAPLSASEIYSTALNYILTPEELRDNDFPLQSVLNDSSAFVCAPPSVPLEYYLLSIDCEMCVTSKGLELTRCAVVDLNGNLIYDQLVKPENEILNYLTKYSGITKETLESVSTRLSDVQQYLTSIISQNTILIGHSLENDLNALKFYHNKIIDTSILYPHERGPPSKQSLKSLSQTHLNRDIQNENNGHNPIEDAKSSAHLVKLILLNGPKLKNFEEGYESLFDYIYDASRVKSLMIDRRHVIDQYISSPNYAINVSSDDDIVKVFKEGSVPLSKLSSSNNNIHISINNSNSDINTTNNNNNDNNDNSNNNNNNDNQNMIVDKENFEIREFKGIIWTQLVELQLYCQSHSFDSNQPFLNDEKFIALCKKTNQNIADIVDSLKENTIVVLFTGRANERYFKECAKRIKEGALNEEEELIKRVAEARKGVSFFTVITPS